MKLPPVSCFRLAFSVPVLYPVCVSVAQRRGQYTLVWVYVQYESEGFMKKFEERMRELQGERTQKEFANFLGIPLNTYTNWLLYQRRPTIDAVISICTKLGVSADWLLGITDVRVPGAVGTNQALARENHDLKVENEALKQALAIVGGRPARPVKPGGAPAAKIA